MTALLDAAGVGVIVVGFYFITLAVLGGLVALAVVLIVLAKRKKDKNNGSGPDNGPSA